MAEAVGGSGRSPETRDTMPAIPARSLNIALAVLLVVLVVLGGWHGWPERSPPRAWAGLWERLGPAREVAPERLAPAGHGRARVLVEDAGGVGESLVMALDEAVVRDSRGMETVVRLDPPAGGADLAVRLAGLGGPREVFPVVYPRDSGRSDATRRLVTPDLRVRVAAEDAAAVARQAGLEISERPSYAPGWVIMTAADAFAALDALAVVRRAAGVEAADVLLAARRFTRAPPNDPLYANQWHLKRSGAALAGTDVNIESVWNFGGAGFRGDQIRIGIVDDGVESAHNDLKDNIDATLARNWNGSSTSAEPTNNAHHGTACAGLAAARGNNSIGVVGAAPMAKLVSLRLIAASTTDAQEASAMEHEKDAIQIKSNSWGPSDSGGVLEGPGPLTRAAFASAVATGRGGLGTIFVWAAGNGATNGDNSNYDGYANRPETIAVGAIDSLGRAADYSERGANLVVCAPSGGASPSLTITTTDLSGSKGSNTAGGASGDYLTNFTGTSAATPVVAGITALMLQRNPQLGWRDVQEILIRSATKFQPADSGWVTNAAGIPFHHQFGAGLVNAAAAVTMAATWTNLPPRQSGTVAETETGLAIPRQSTTGLVRTYEFSGNLRLEHVTATLSISHPSRGNLEITLTSPDGTPSRLAEVHTGSSGGYSNWTFGSVRHWGEHSSGIWTLRIRDLGSGSTSVGTLNSAELAFHGSPAGPPPPRPLVSVVQPTQGQSLSPAAPVSVEVSAVDPADPGNPARITRVELSLNGAVVAVKSSPPWQFAVSPGPGSHTVEARATDADGRSGESAARGFTVENQPPQVTAATLGGPGPWFSDTPLPVTGLTASDPEGDPVTFLYQWQFSGDGMVFADAFGATAATLPASPAHGGKRWRCVITPLDPGAAGPPFVTGEVNLLHRPPTEPLQAGEPFAYHPGLVLRRGGPVGGRQAIINEFSHGPAGGGSQWVELLALEGGSFAGWSLADGHGNALVVSSDAAWSQVPAGTLIVIYNGQAPKDPRLPADDADPADGRMIVGSTDAALFAPGGAAWLSLAHGGGSLSLRNPASGVVHSIAYGDGIPGGTGPWLGALGDGASAAFLGDSDPAADLAGHWRTSGSHALRHHVPRAAGDLFFSEYVAGTSNNKALELFNPGPAAVDLGGHGYKVEIYYNGSGTAQGIILLAGTIAPGGTFVLKHPSASAAIIAQQTSNSLTFNGNDAIVLRKGVAVTDRIGQVGVNPGTAWSANGVSTADATLRRKPGVMQGDTAHEAAFDPSLQWDAYPVDDFSGLGSHGFGSALAVEIAPPVLLVTPDAPAAAGVVSIPAALAFPLTVALAASDPAVLAVPATVVIPAGQLASPAFPVAALDDGLPGWPREIGITASAAGYVDGISVVSVLDAEDPDFGPSPAAANGVANAAFVSSLRAGTAAGPARFRIAAGLPPPGLALDEITGLLSGIPARPAGGAAEHTFTIERFNPLGESVTLTLTLAVTSAYDDWLAGFPALADPEPAADPDGDGLANVLEFALGSDPQIAETDPPVTVTREAGGVALVYRRSKTAAGVTLVPEWSPDLEAGHWHAAGLEITTLEETADYTLMRAFLPVSPADPRRFLRLRASLP